MPDCYKVGYPDRASAERVVRRMKRTHRRNRGGHSAPASLMSYRCPHCDQFHVGNRRRLERRRESLRQQERRGR